jgi:diguanylate cyclase (GGDEF)-like protein
MVDDTPVSGLDRLIAPEIRRGRFSRLIEGRSQAFVVACGVGLTLLVGALDFRTGWELSFSVFYLIPIALVAWYAGRWPGVGTAVLSALILAFANRLAGETHGGPFVPVWNALVQALARVDGVTGVRNARAFREMVEREVARAGRYGSPLTLAYLDADGFKAVNDSLGHSAGDRILQTIGRTLEAQVRATDVVARLGGDEFAVLFPETGPDVAETALRKLQRGLGEAMAREGVRVTFCIGAVTARRNGKPADELIRRADALMYDVKRAGKNAIKLESLADA